MVSKILLFIATLFFIFAQKNYIHYILSVRVVTVEWDSYFKIIQNLTYTYSFLFFILFIIDFFFKGVVGKKIYIISKKAFNIFNNKKNLISKTKISIKYDNIIIISIFIIGIIVRVYKLQFNITYDEAATYMDYIDEGITSLFFYKSPNNHIFHSILAKISISIWGVSQYALRFPAILFGSFNILLIYYLTRKISNKLTAIISCFFLSAHPLIIHYDTLARGYSIITTCSLLLFYACWEYKRTYNFGYLILIPIVSCVGFFTHLPFLFSFSGIILWFLYELYKEGKEHKKYILSNLIFIFIGTFFLSLVLYTPTLILGYGIDQFINNKYFISSNIFGEYPGGLFSFFIRLSDYFFFKSKIICLGVFILLAVNYSKIKILSTFFILQLIVFFIITGIMRSIPPERTLLFLLPFIIIAISISISSLLKSHYKKIIFLPLIHLQFTFFIINQNMLQKYNGYPELQFIIDFLKQDPLPVLVVNRSYNICKPLKYYFQINNITDPIDFINFKNIRSTDLMNLDSSNYVILNKSDKIEKNNFKIVFETNDYQILKSIH